MKPLTIRIREERKETLESEADEYGVSVSEYVRELIEKGREYDELSERLEAREDRIEELEDQLARRSQIEERVEEVALEVRDKSAKQNAPFFVNWWNWWQNRE